jgi:hypothetical protein
MSEHCPAPSWCGHNSLVTSAWGWLGAIKNGLYPKTLSLHIDIQWNVLYAQLQSIHEQKDQIEKFVDSVQHLLAADKIPVLDAEYWTLLLENMAIMQLFLCVNFMITLEDGPALSTLLVCVAMLKLLLGLLQNLCCQEWLAEHNQLRMHVPMKNQGLMYSTIKVRERHPRPHHEGATVFARG